MRGVQFDVLLRNCLSSKVYNSVLNGDSPMLTRLQLLLQVAPAHHDYNIAVHVRSLQYQTMFFRLHTKAKLRFVLRIEDQYPKKRDDADYALLKLARNTGEPPGNFPEL